MLRRALLVLAVLFICGCTKRTIIEKKSINLYDQEVEDYKRLEARFSDISIILNAIPIAKGVSDNSYSYKVLMNKEQIALFYKEDMENNGWRELTGFSGFEDLYIYEKPHKYAVISIRPSSEFGASKGSLEISNEVIIFLINK